MQSVRVLAHLDRPVRLLFWSLDELVVMMIPFLVGIFSGSFVVILVGIVLYRFYRKNKRRYSAKRIKSLLYWYLPGRFVWMMPSYQRHFVG